MLIVLTLIIGMLGTLGFLKAASDNVVEIVPQNTVWAEPANAIGSTFTVNVTITNATSINTWRIRRVCGGIYLSGGAPA